MSRYCENIEELMIKILDEEKIKYEISERNKAYTAVVNLNFFNIMESLIRAILLYSLELIKKDKAIFYEYLYTLPSIEANLQKDVIAKVAIVRCAVTTLCREALERNQAKIEIISQGKYHFFCVVFVYNSVTYYWWEKYENVISFKGGISHEKFIDIQRKGGIDNKLYWDWRISDVTLTCTYTLEFQFRVNPKITYVGFSTNPIQSPLMCVGDFKNVKL